uniref:two-partner secretion domain-containing protein n=1 Tax=Aquincola tertiaricarbonis TaxID=391953 RepID=UPI000AD1FBBD
MRERSHPHHRPVLRRAARPLATALKPVCLAAALAAGALPAQALPTGAQVTAGQVQVGTPQGGQLVIRQTTGKAGIDWQGFSIGAGERVQVQQPGASSILFNRVVGAEPSVILGQLQANGRVFLSNPRGILFGAGSQVDVGGLVATTLNLDPQALANGRYQLTRGLDQPGELRAEGDIRASGTVALVGPTLVQGGHISGARVGLAAAGAVQVDVEGDGLIFFHMRHEDLATRLSVLGQVLADGGSVEARAVARSGFADTVLNMDGIVRARSIGQREGRVVIDGGSAGITTMAGTVDVSGQQPGQQGGQAELLGEKLLLSGTARIDARGDAGGGTVLVGGNWQGQGPQPNARMTAVAAGAQIDASARRSGDGGTVVVWSDEATRYQGRIAARGGEAGGDGGQVEVSGKRFLDYQGSADLLAPKGRSGRLLLDPTNITIDDLATPDVNDDGVSEDLGSPTLAFADPGTNSRISASAVQTQLGAGSVTLQATNDLFVNSTITSTNGSSLTLQAGNNINVAAAISVTGAGANLTLSANDAGGPASGAGRVALGAAVTAAGTVSITQGVSSTPHQLGADISATSLVLDGAATLVNPRIWTLSGASTVAASLGGAGTLTQAGGGSLVLTGANSFGGLTINAGNTLQVGNGGTT